MRLESGGGKENGKEKTRRRWLAAVLPAMAGIVTGGCLSVKTQHEIKPIHITMDVNLKVQKELEAFLNLD